MTYSCTIQLLQSTSDRLEHVFASNYKIICRKVNQADPIGSEFNADCMAIELVKVYLKCLSLRTMYEIILGDA